jgi:Cu/Ag efflux protein CusF
MRLRGLAGFITLLILVFAPLPSVASKHAARQKVPQPAGSTVDNHHHPKGWRFTIPKGDPQKGRAVFEKFECYYCHEVRGEPFPHPVESAPELSQMGPMHPLEYFAESIMNPNAVVGKKYREPDGRSPMTNFTEKMTVRELIDVAAYVASLRPKSAAKMVRAEGKVVALVPENGEIVLSHDEIKGFMDAMIMGYKVSSPALMKAVKPGDAVQFTIDTEKQLITEISKSQAPLDRKK